MKQQVEQQEEQQNEKSLQEQEQKWFTLLREEQEKRKRQQETEINSRISVQLTKAIAYERTPELFDPDEILERDKELLEDLRESDEALNLERKNKPVILSPTEAKVVYAFAFVLGKYRNTPVIQEIIKNPFSEEEVSMNVDINSLSKLIYGSNKQRERNLISETIERLSQTYQVFPIKTKDTKGREWEIMHYSKILNAGSKVKAKLLNPDEALPDEETEKDFVRVQLGRIFFIGLNNRFAIVTRKLFEVWRTGKKGELFHILFSSILSAYSRCRTAAKKIEKRLREENKNLKDNKLSEADLHKKIKQAQEEAGAWEYELTYESIKKRVRTDYESKRPYKVKFKKDLQSVIADFIEIGLITDRTQIDVKGRTGTKVVFYLNEDYSKLDETNTLPPVKENKQLPPANET